MDVINKDHQKWLDIMSAEDIEDRLKSKRKSPIHVQVMPTWLGASSTVLMICVISLERSSARETTMRVAVGAVAKRLFD